MSGNSDTTAFIGGLFQECPLVKRVRVKRVRRDAGKLLLPVAASVDGGLAGDPVAEGLARAVMPRLGFPVDWWAGCDVAMRWQCGYFPSDCCPESIRQWLRVAALSPRFAGLFSDRRFQK